MSNAEFDDDDFEDSEFDDEGFEEFQSDSSGTLGDLWRNNPLVKVGVMMGAVALVVGVIVVFGGKKEQSAISAVKRGQDVTEVPGSGAISQSMQEAIEERNEEATEVAIREQSSVMPIPTEPQLERLEVPDEEPDQEDPLERWRMLQAERQAAAPAPEPEPVVAAPPPPQIDTQRIEAVNVLADAMASQMGSILELKTLNGMQSLTITTPDFLDQLAEERASAAAEVAAAAQAELPEEEEVEVIVVPAGAIEYAQLITEATTDAPGPVLAEVASGPLQGARVLGTFEATNEYLVLNFDTIVVDGISQQASAVALDPKQANIGVITEIDRRYFQRAILPAAAAFVEGLTEAISESGSTTITISSDSGGSQSTSQQNNDRDSDQEIASGISELGAELGSIIDEEASEIEPLLRVAAGTPIGILFLEPVLENPQ